MKVLTIEQMNRLKELGVDVSNASVRVGQMFFYHGDSWYGVDSYNVHLFKDDDDDTSCFEEEYKAFTLQDVIELLPKSIIVNSLNHWFCVSQNCLLTEFQIMYVDGNDSYSVIKQNKSLLQASYNMLLWVIENGYLKTK